jgi:uncharacterized protein YndB with AHSA1/START domain
VTERWIRLERPLEASPARVYRAWTAPEELAMWFPLEVEGSLAPGTRSFLVWPLRRVWIDILEAEPDRRFRFRWPLLPEDPRSTEVTVSLEPRGYGTKLILQDGVFDLGRPDELEAWAIALEGWASALANLRAQLDFSVDLRPRR